MGDNFGLRVIRRLCHPATAIDLPMDILWKVIGIWLFRVGLDVPSCRSDLVSRQKSCCSNLAMIAPDNGACIKSHCGPY